MVRAAEFRDAGDRPRARVLITTGDQGLRSELTGLLQPLGYELATIRTAAYSLASAEVTPPDIAVLDQHLPDMSGAELCRRLQRMPSVGPSTPILVTLPPDADPGARRDALRSGAWSVLSRPIDSDEFLQKLQTYTEARLHRERAALEGLVDPVTGLYNRKGVARWARELGALAYRRQVAFACLAIAPVLADEDEPEGVDRAVSHVVDVLRTVRRGGDVIGRLAKVEFVVLALETNAVGAVRYAGRLAEAAGNAGQGAPALRVRYQAVENARKTPIDALEMVGRAIGALRRARSGPWTPWLAPLELSSD